MKIQSTLLAAAMLAALAAVPAHAAQALRATAAGDQVPAALVAAPLPADDSGRVPLAAAGALEPAQPVQAPGAYAAVSRS